MSVARVLGMSLWGLEGRIVEVECEISRGLPAFVIVGLPDSSTLQARERVKSACANAGHAVGEKKVTVNLSPAWMKKSGSGFDLPIAVATLAAKGVLPPEHLENTLFIAELALEGSLRPVPGILPAVRAAAKSGVRRVVVAEANADEARLVPGIDVHSACHLGEVLNAFGGEAVWSRRGLFDLEEEENPGEPPTTVREQPDFLDVKGQKLGREAAEIAAAGGHHMLLLGPPGAGKSMIASRLPSILPPLEPERALELSAIASIAGEFDASKGLVSEAPFIAPHHTSSVASIIGGGSNLASPGAVSRAHGGVLFFDESCNGKCTSFSKEVTDGNEHEHDGASSRPERAARTSYAVGGIPGVHPDWTGRAVAGNEADLPVLAAVEVPQGQGRCDRAAAA